MTAQSTYLQELEIISYSQYYRGQVRIYAHKYYLLTLKQYFKQISYYINSLQIALYHLMLLIKYPNVYSSPKPWIIAINM